MSDKISCHHGALKRSCQFCEYEEEISLLRAEVAQLKQDAISGRQEVDKLCDLYRRDYVTGLVEENSRLRGIEERVKDVGGLVIVLNRSKVLRTSSAEQAAALSAWVLGGKG